MENNKNMIEVRNAWKKFGNVHTVLCGVNLSVEKSIIYGLLGPSGCGKTTLLNCLLELKRLTSGVIRLGVDYRKDIGYMPQEVALFKEFTVIEVLRFYSSLFGLRKQTARVRIEELKKVLDLPQEDKIIGTLSGGEQRRVSFAAALVHNPKLLLLDEPTVGLDPILSHSMWQFLKKISESGKTVVITTHYIEEANNTNKIGMMREGRVICEDSPHNIMTIQQVGTLEEAFLKLSQLQDPKKAVEHEKAESNVVEQKKNLSNSESFSMNRLLAQLVKNILWFKRNTVIMSLLLLLPFLQAFLYCVTFGYDPRNIKLLILSNELEGGVGRACEHYDNSPNTNATIWFSSRIDYFEEFDGNLTCTINQPFTCAYAELLNNDFDLEFKTDLIEAEHEVSQNKAWGIISIKSNFSDSLLERLIDQTNITDETIEMSQVFLQLDMSNYVISKYIRKQIITHFRTLIENVAASCGMPHYYGTSPLLFKDPIFGKKDPVFSHDGVPGFVCAFCFFFALIFTSGAIMMEKIVGTLERSFAAGMTYLEVVVAHLLVQFVLMTLQKAVMLLVFYYWWDYPYVGKMSLIVALLYFVEFVGISLGFLFTEVFSEDRLVTFASIGSALFAFTVGGIVWPHEGAHILLRYWMWYAPIAPASRTYKNIASKAYDITHPTVYLGFLSCLLWTMLLGVISYAIAKVKRNHQKL